MARTLDINTDSIDSNPTTPTATYKDHPDFKGLPIAEQWHVMAEKGDVRGLLSVIDCDHRREINFVEFGEYLHRALAALAQVNPTAFGEFIYSEMLVASSKLIIKARFILDRQLNRQYESRQSRGEWFSATEDDEVVARMMALHLHVAKLQEMAANIRRIHEQTRKLRLANDKAEAKKNRTRQSSQRRRSSTSRQRPTLTSRIGGELQ